MIAPLETTTIVPGILGTEVQLITENYLEKAIPALPARRKLRVLALHGSLSKKRNFTFQLLISTQASVKVATTFELQ